MQEESLTCASARSIDLADYLASLGYTPQKVRGQDYWYRSPLRVEKEPSFKVNRKLNLWYDHGMGRGGTLLDFGMLYHGCGMKELLQRLSSLACYFPSHPHPLSEPEKRELLQGKITIVDVRPITAPSLTAYLQERKVPLPLARQYCDEVTFRLYGREHIVLGFKNSAGGYELRSADFKGSSSPKTYTLLGTDVSQIALFEGFFSFLSYQAMLQQQKAAGSGAPPEVPCFLVLNSLSLLERSRPLLQGAPLVHLFLDRDAAGRRATELVQAFAGRSQDHSGLYKEFKDLNDYLVQGGGYEKVPRQNWRPRL